MQGLAPHRNLLTL